MKLWLWVTWYNFCKKVDSVITWFEKDMPKPGGPLPSLTDVQFIRMEGYARCMQDIHSFMKLTQTQSDQLVLIRLIEFLTREVNNGTK